MEKILSDYHFILKTGGKKILQSMLLRDRNHPSIIMWSIGNEIPERQTAEGDSTASILADFVRSLDSTRPITSAYNSVDEKADAFFAALDVAGYNYNLNKYAEDHQRKPNRVIVCTESYPLTAFDYWMGVVDNPWVIGDFVWTGFDYIGEASIGWRGYMHRKKIFIRGILLIVVILISADGSDRSHFIVMHYGKKIKFLFL